MKPILSLCLSISLLFALNTHIQADSGGSTQQDTPIPPLKELSFNTLITPHLVNQIPFLDKLFNPLFDALHQQTGGALRPKYYSPNELTPVPEIYNSIVTGKADMAFSVISHAEQDQFPITSLFMLARVDQFTDRPAYAAWRMLSEWPEVQREWSDVKVLFQFGENDGGIATVSKPIHSIDDIKGLKLICFTAMAAKQLKALGGIPVVEASSIEAILNMLEAGEADGLVYNIPNFMAEANYGFARLLKYSVDLRIGSIFAYTIMSKKTWENLSTSEQVAVDNIFNKEAFILADTTLEEINADDYRMFIKKFGMERIQLSPEEKAKAAKLLDPVREDYAEFLDSKGHNGKELMQRFDRLMAEYAQ